MAEYIRIEGIEECLRAFNGLESDLRKNANGELRQASKAIASSLVPLLGGSGAPQESRIIAAAGPKSDRYVVLAVPNRKPKLSGLRKVPAGRAKTMGFAVEAGSEFTPGTPGGMVAAHRDAMARHAIPRYTAAVYRISKKWGLV